MSITAKTKSVQTHEYKNNFHLSDSEIDGCSITREWYVDPSFFDRRRL